MKHKRAAGTIVMAAFVALAVAAPAATADTARELPLTKKQMLAASIRLSDVPASFSDDPSRSFSYSGPDHTAPFEMCVDKDGHKVFGPRPAQRANASIGLSQTGSGSNITAAEAVSTDIYGYRSTAKADKAWRALQAARARCAPTLTKPLDYNGVSIDILVVQTLADSKAYKGKKGFTNEQDVSTEIAGGASTQELNIFVDGYTSYRRHGTTIVRAQFANYDQESLQSVSLKPEWRAFTRQEAKTVVDRIAPYPGQ